MWLVRWKGSLQPSTSGDLFGEGEGVEGFEQNCRYAEASKPTLIDALDLGGEEKDRDVGDGRILLHVPEGGWTVDVGHHDVHEDRVRLLCDGKRDSTGTGACCEDMPASHRLKREGSYLADVVFVVDDRMRRMSVLIFSCDGRYGR